MLLMYIQERAELEIYTALYKYLEKLQYMVSNNVSKPKKYNKNMHSVSYKLYLVRHKAYSPCAVRIIVSWTLSHLNITKGLALMQKCKKYYCNYAIIAYCTIAFWPFYWS